MTNTTCTCAALNERFPNNATTLRCGVCREKDQRAENLRRMKELKAAYHGLDSKGFMLSWPTGVHSLLKFSTEMLQADVEEGQYGVMTHSRQARELLRLDTVDRRKRADAEAGTRQNLRGGIHSDNLRDAVSDLLRMIEEGREDEEMWAEGAARRHREAEAEMRRVTGRQVILYPPEMRRD